VPPGGPLTAGASVEVGGGVAGGAVAPGEVAGVVAAAGGGAGGAGVGEAAGAVSAGVAAGWAKALAPAANAIRLTSARRMERRSSIADERRRPSNEAFARSPSG
jgi:hypothetical protein